MDFLTNDKGTTYDGSLLSDELNSREHLEFLILVFISQFTIRVLGSGEERDVIDGMGIAGVDNQRDLVVLLEDSVEMGKGEDCILLSGAVLERRNSN